ncbi:MAG: nucleotide exchange factor GrpE [Holophagaceae bacterium]|nr:nucleotide exchange factor GrpE [Holophagaceae bacterium]
MVPEPYTPPDKLQPYDLDADAAYTGDVSDANTVELSLDDADAIDLQALADEAANATPEFMAAGDDSEAEDTAGTGPILLDPELPAATATAEDYERQLDRLQAQMGELEKRESDVMDHYKRLKAEYLNYRDRSARDTQVALNQGDRKVLLEILPVLDNFERSLDASYPDMDAFRVGVELIHKQFVDALRRIGAEPVTLNVGDPFDALHSEALTTLSNPNLPDGAIAAIYERGYMLRDQLLRPARVVVNHNPDAETSPNAESNVH